MKFLIVLMVFSIPLVSFSKADTVYKCSLELSQSWITDQLSSEYRDLVTKSFDMSLRSGFKSFKRGDFIHNYSTDGEVPSGLYVDNFEVKVHYSEMNSRSVIRPELYFNNVKISFYAHQDSEDLKMFITRNGVKMNNGEWMNFDINMTCRKSSI